MGFKLPSIQELKLKANMVQSDVHSDSNRTEIDYNEHEELNAKQHSLPNSHFSNYNIQKQPVSMQNISNMPNPNYIPKDQSQQQFHQQNVPQQMMVPPMYQNMPPMNQMVMPPNQNMVNYNNMMMVPPYYMNPNFMYMNNQQYYNNAPNNYMMQPNNMMQQQMPYTKPKYDHENKIHKPLKKFVNKPKKTVAKSNEPCIEYEIKYNNKSKKDIDIIEKVKRSLLKNRQGRPITNDLSINATLYESLNDYILHYLRKNFNLDYWYSQDINLDSISYINGGNKEITEITKKLRKDIDLDNLKENDSVVINNLDILKFLYLEKNKIETKNFNYKLPFNKSKIVINPVLDEGNFFPQTETHKELFDIDIYKKIEIKPHGNYAEFDENEGRNNSSGTENVCKVKKSQILYTVKDSVESIIPELKRRMRLKPNQKLAILKQYKRNMLTKGDNKGRSESASSVDSKIVMFDYIPIINEHEINIEFFKKIICYPKYRTNYDLILIKRDDTDPSTNHQIRCYFDKEIFLETIKEYKSIKDNLYGHFIKRDINTALTGTMMFNYNGDISFQSYMKFNQHRKFMPSSEDEDEDPKGVDQNKPPLAGKFKTFPSGVEYFEREEDSKDEENNAKFMCYDLWVLDFN